MSKNDSSKKVDSAQVQIAAGVLEVLEDSETQRKIGRKMAIKGLTSGYLKEHGAATTSRVAVALGPKVTSDDLFGLASGKLAQEEQDRILAQQEADSSDPMVAGNVQ